MYGNNNINVASPSVETQLYLTYQVAVWVAYYLAIIVYALDHQLVYTKPCLPAYHVTAKNPTLRAPQAARTCTDQPVWHVTYKWELHGNITTTLSITKLSWWWKRTPWKDMWWKKINQENISVSDSVMLKAGEHPKDKEHKVILGADIGHENKTAEVHRAAEGNCLLYVIYDLTM